MSVDKGLWYGLFYRKQIGVQYAQLWIDWAEYTEEHELNWAEAWGIYEEAKKFIHDANECAEIDEAYRFVQISFIQTVLIIRILFSSVRLPTDFKNGIKKVRSSLFFLREIRMVIF